MHLCALWMAEAYMVLLRAVDAPLPNPYSLQANGYD